MLLLLLWGELVGCLEKPAGWFRFLMSMGRFEVMPESDCLASLVFAASSGCRGAVVSEVNSRGIGLAPNAASEEDTNEEMGGDWVGWLPLPRLGCAGGTLGLPVPGPCIPRATAC